MGGIAAEVLIDLVHNIGLSLLILNPFDRVVDGTFPLGGDVSLLTSELRRVEVA